MNDSKVATVGGIVAMLQRTERLVNWAFIVLAGLVAFVLMLLISVDVAGRYLLGTSLKGTVELSQVMLVVIVYAGITHQELVGGHIKVDLFFTRFPRWLQAALGIAIAGTMAILFLVLARQSWIAFELSWRLQEGTMGELVFPVWVPKLMLFLGFLLFAAHSTGSFLLRLAIRRPPEGKLS